jgi:hypothetical protein
MGTIRWQSAARGRGLAVTALIGVAVLGIGTATALAAPLASRGAAQATTQGQHKASTLAADPAGPTLKLIAVERLVEAAKFGGWTYIDPDIYLASLGSAFQVDVARASYTQPVQATEIIRTPDGTVHRSLPSWVMAGWTGIRHFIRITIRNARGRVVAANELPFCPDSGQLAKATPNSAETDPFPTQCVSGDPFPMGEVWGLSRGWAVDAYGDIGYHIAVGTYKLTETISPQYARLFHVSKRDASVTVKIKVTNQSTCCSPTGCCLPVPAPAGFVRASPRAGSQARRAEASGHRNPHPCAGRCAAGPDPAAVMGHLDQQREEVRHRVPRLRRDRLDRREVAA